MDTKEKELEERIETLTERRTLFLIFGIIAIVLGTCMPIMGTLIQTETVLLSTLFTLVGESLVSGGVALLILRFALLGRRLKRAQKELNDLKLAKKEIEMAE